MKYDVLVSFSGVVSASCGEQIEITDKVIAADLLQAGYIKATPTKARKKKVSDSK